MTSTPVSPPTGPWGPDGRRGALALAVDLAHAGTSPGAVATVLDLFDRRRVPSTWSLPAGTDPALLDRLWFTGHEAAALVPTLEGDGLGEALAALASHDTPVVGARVEEEPTLAGTELVATARRHGLVHLTVPSRAAAVLAVDAPPGAGPVVLLGTGDGPTLADVPDAWLAAAQVGLGRAVQHGTMLVLRIDPVALDRSGAFGPLVEAVDLAVGLVRAERLHVDRLARLVADLAGVAS